MNTPRGVGCTALGTTRLKRILKVFNLRFSTAGECHGDDIETVGAIGCCGVAHEVTSRTPDSAALLAVHRQSVVLSLARPACFHFDKNDHGGLRRDEVDLAGGASVVTSENAVTMPPQISGRGTLPSATQEEVFARRPTPPTPQAPQPSFDGCEVHAACGPFRSSGGGSTASPDAPVRGAAP